MMAPSLIMLSDHHCRSVEKVANVGAKYFDGNGGTSPSAILQQRAALDEIKKADLWVLLTDGEVRDSEVQSLTQLAELEGVIRVPVILVIVGERRVPPERENISVGVSFFASASDALILYKEAKANGLYLIDAKGMFTPLRVEGECDLSDWAKLTRFESEYDLRERITSKQIMFNPDRGWLNQKGISLGQEWDNATENTLVKVAALLEENQIHSPYLSHLLQEEAINQLALSCKTRGRLGDLRNLLLRHKQGEAVVRLEDRHGAGRIMDMIHSTSDSSEKSRLTEELRRAHHANRETYQRLKDSPTEEVKDIARLNRLIDRGLQIISDFEKSSYTADILDRKSNRARRAEKVSADNTELKLTTLDLQDEAHAFRGACAICCGENEIMSVALKQVNSVEENTSDFALNFPLAAAYARQNAEIISSQSICFQCAILLDRSIYQENIAATVPTVDFQSSNRTYIRQQLYLALTAGLATGMSGVVQLFAAMLHQTLTTKSWCAELKDGGDSESSSRRAVLDWLLRNLLKGCPCRQNFSETGDWVRYPQALQWAIDEFNEAELDSWIIQYPISGFNTMMSWVTLLDLEANKESLRAIWNAKLLHLVTSAFMEKLLKFGPANKDWKHPFVQLLYKECNTLGIPQDRGSESLVQKDTFWERITIVLGNESWADYKLFLDHFKSDADATLIARLQMVVFWALFHLQHHTKPKTFFTKMRNEFPLAISILNTKLIFSDAAVCENLMSIFAPKPTSSDVFLLHNSDEVPPYASPYGASVLKCGIAACGKAFYGEEDLEKGRITLQGLRDGRREHLHQVFNLAEVASSPGLPEPTSAPKPPLSNNITLHISVARVWARADRQTRLELMRAVDDRRNDEEKLKEFVSDCRAQICGESGRGNIYRRDIDKVISAVLPSFMKALRKASRKNGLEDDRGCSWEMNFADNNLEWKMKYEMEMHRH